MPPRLKTKKQIIDCSFFIAKCLFVWLCVCVCSIHFADCPAGWLFGFDELRFSEFIFVAVISSLLFAYFHCFHSLTVIHFILARFIVLFCVCVCVFRIGFGLFSICCGLCGYLLLPYFLFAFFSKLLLPPLFGNYS